MDSNSVSIVSGYVVGCVARIVELESSFYKKTLDLGCDFEIKTARALSTFVANYDRSRDGLWLVFEAGRVEGAIAVDGKNAHGEGAQLRWFIISDLVRGTGFGNILLWEAINFCREKGYSRLYLWTFDGPSAARHLYEKHGFKLTHRIPSTYEGVVAEEVRFELAFRNFPHQRQVTRPGMFSGASCFRALLHTLQHIFYRVLSTVDTLSSSRRLAQRLRLRE